MTQRQIHNLEIDEVWSLLRSRSEGLRPEEVAQQLLLLDLEHALLDLPERQYELLTLRFGLGGGAPLTLAEVGARLGISRERARQLEGLALRTLQRRLEGGDAPAGPAPAPGGDDGAVMEAMAAG